MLKNEIELSGWRNPSELVSKVLNQMDSEYNLYTEPDRITSGFIQLDEVMRRKRPWSVLTLAGGSGAGKTSMALQIAHHVSAESKGCVGYFSLRESSSLLTERLICSSALVNFQHIRDGFRKKNDSSKINTAAEKISKGRLYFEDAPYLDFSLLRSKALALLSQQQVDLFIIDDLEALQLGTQLTRSSLAEVLPFAIKSLAAELQVPFLVLCRMQTEARKFSSVPAITDIQSLKSLENYSDFIAFLWRHPPDEALMEEAELIVQSTSGGQTNQIPFLFHKNELYFMEVVDEEDASKIS